MKHQIAFAALTVGLGLTFSVPAAAQTKSNAPVFVDVNVGAQPQSRTLSTSTSFPLYGETAVVNAAEGIDGGALFDLSAGYRFMPHLSAGVGFSIFSKTGSGSLAASIPSPNFVNRPATSTVSTDNLKHKETATHLMLGYLVPVGEDLSVRLSVGPSFFHLTQDVLTATVPAGTQTANVATDSQTASATGVNVGVNIDWMANPMYGVGVFARYAGAKVDLDSAKDVKVGGFQIGAGARLRF